MSFSYNFNLPTAKDRLRFQLGDTDEDDPLLPDETITKVLSDNSDNETVSLRVLAGALVAQYSRKPNRQKIGGTEEEWTGRLDHWRTLLSAGTGGFRIIDPYRETAESEFG